jgi:hypothetical protein
LRRRNVYAFANTNPFARKHGCILFNLTMSLKKGRYDRSARLTANRMDPDYTVTKQMQDASPCHEIFAVRAEAWRPLQQALVARVMEDIASVQTSAARRAYDRPLAIVCDRLF